MINTPKFHAGTGRAAAVLALSLALLATQAFAQNAGESSQGPQATPLPLSGRSGQSGSVRTTEAPIAGTTASVNTTNPTLQVQGGYGESASSTPAMPFSGMLSLRDAIARGLRFNLGAVGLNQAVAQAHGLMRTARSNLLPNVNANATETIEEVNLNALGFRISIPIPGFQIPALVGPFNYIDLRASLSQTVLNLTQLNNYRAASRIVQANRFAAQDARDLIVFAVGGEYLQVIAARSRVRSAQAQLDTANALYQQTSQSRAVGLVAQVDVDRGQVEVLTQQQRLVSLQNDLAKQKINLARMTGLPPNDRYDLSDDVPYSPAAETSVEDAVSEALQQRWDIRSAESQIAAGERAVAAARAERYPSVSVTANDGEIGTNPAQLRNTFAAAATLKIPVWQGGRTEGDVEQARAALAQRQAELEDLKAQAEADVRQAFLDLQAATSQVEVSQKNLQVSQEALALTRQSFDAGVIDNVQVVQAQQTVAGAQLDYINSVFAHNLAKLSLARATGRADEKFASLLKIQPQ